MGSARDNIAVDVATERGIPVTNVPAYCTDEVADALVAALRDRAIAGAGLDAFVPEHLPASHPLLALDNVVATPHTAFYSEESIADLARLAAQNVADVLAGRRPASVVNPVVL